MKKTALNTQSRQGESLFGHDKGAARQRFFLFPPPGRWIAEYKRADNPCLPVRGYRLCVYASGSVITVVLNCFTLIIISRLHFGQYSGKFSSTVLSQILILVLLLQLGHNSHSVFFILCFSSDSRISMDNYIYNSRSFHRLVETITHAPTMSTVKTM